MGQFASLFHFAEINPLTPQFKDLEEGARVPFLPLENIWAYGKADQSLTKAWKKSDTSYTQFQDGDILIPKVTPTVFHGRSMITDIDSEVGLATSEVHVLRCKSGVESRWILYNLLSGKFLDEARGAVYGVGGLQRISAQYLQSYKLVSASLDTQRRIADYLDAETAQIDTLVAELDEYVELLEKRRREVVTRSVTYGIPGEEVMAGFPMVPVGLVSTVIQSNVDKKSKDGEPTVQLLNYTDVYYNDRITMSGDYMVATASQEQIERLALRVGDVVITKDSETADDIGIPTFVCETAEDFVCAYHLSILRPGSGMLNGEYLFWCLKSQSTANYWESHANGVTRVSIPSTTVTSLKIPLPDLNTQRRIADYLDAETTKIDTIINECRELKDLLLKRRQVLITDVVTGKVEV